MAQKKKKEEEKKIKKWRFKSHWQSGHADMYVSSHYLYSLSLKMHPMSVILGGPKQLSKAAAAAGG